MNDSLRSARWPRRLLVLATYPISAAATRYRTAAYFEALRARGIESELHSFYDEREFAGLYRGNFAENARGTLRGIRRTLGVGLNATQYDAVLVQREAAPLGPALLEAFLDSVRRLPIIYDFDDAVWLSQHERSAYPRLARLLRPEKSLALMRRASAVIAGSQALAAKARELNDNVIVLPTSVPEMRWMPPPTRALGDFASEPPVIGWIGTHSTAPQLEPALRALESMAGSGLRFRLRTVGAGDRLPRTSLPVEGRAWRLEHEVRDFQSIDLGLSPMFDDAWSAGKCGFKQIQYMASGIPMVSSPVGGAKEFLTDERDALFASTVDEWRRQLTRLLTDHALRRRLAIAALDKFRRELSVEAQSERFVGVIENSIMRANGA